MKALVTGCSGFIGSHLAEALLEKGYQVIGLDNLSTGREENISGFYDNSLFEFIKGDSSDKFLLDKLIKSSDVVYHLAASVGVKLLTENPVYSLENNVKSTMNIMELCGIYRKKIFYASSSEVYGKLDKKLLSEEDGINLGMTKISRWGYGCTKAFGEYLALSYFKKYKLPVIIGRFFNVCGPRQTGSYGMVVPRFITAALRNDPITVYGDGAQVRSFMYVKDAVNAVVALMHKTEAKGDVFNIGNPEPVTILGLAGVIKELTNSKSTIVSISYKDAYGDDFEDMHYRVPDMSKLVQITGYMPKINVRNMLCFTIDYWKDNINDLSRASV